MTLVLWSTLSIGSTLSNSVAAANPLSGRDEFAQRLRDRHTGIVDGHSLRVAINMVASNQTRPDRYINTWLDRKVNPDAPVSPGALGPTRYASLATIAKAAGCVCYPVDNCVLIGRPAWVAALSRRIYLSTDSRSNSSGLQRQNNVSADVSWPDLTTPAEALRLAQGHSADLPHDLWPATSLRDISPRLAQQLIEGQFIDEPELSRVTFPFTRSYQFAGSNDTLAALRRVDPNLKSGSRSGMLRLIGSPAAHQLFCARMLSIPVGKPGVADSAPAHGDALKRLQANERLFKFSADDTPAGAMIKALTAKLSIECEFDADANPQLRKIISINVEDQTIYEIVRLIADKASLKILSAGDKLRVSVKQ